MDVDDPLAQQVGSAAQRRHVTLAVAESLTGGMLSSRLAAADNASEWFAGGVVAYSRAVKYGLLGVPKGPVVSGRAALAMASGAAQALAAEVAVAVTGVGGPESQDGKPPGTVWLAVHSSTGHWSGAHHFDGSPEEICRQACDQALRALITELEQDSDRTLRSALTR